MGKYTRKSDRKLVFTQELIEEIKRKLEEGKSKRAIAESIGVHEATLRKRLRVGTVPTSLGRFKPVFDENMELQLANYCRELDKTFYGLTLKTLGSLVFQYAERNGVEHRFNKDKKVAGKDWIHNFCKRHNLSLRSAEKTSLARAAGFNRPQVNLFFKNLEEIVKTKKILPHRIYNMDESGILTVPTKLPKVIAPKGKKAVGKIVSAERGQLVTAVCCMGATGNFIPPALVFPRKRQKPELTDGAPDGTLQLVSDSGFINGDLFLLWIDHFQKFAKSSEEDQVLLILDNHSSHISLQAINKCRQYKINLLSLPPHSSHKLQPLDRGFFGPLKTAYARECDNWHVIHPGRPITQYQIGNLFGKAYAKIGSVERAVSAFKMCGIWPFNPQVFSEIDFAPATVTDIPEPSNVQLEEAPNQQRIQNIAKSSDDDSDPEFLLPLSTFAKCNKSYTETRPATPPIVSSNTQPPTLPSAPQKAFLSPQELRPLPKFERNRESRNRKKMKSVVLTDSPYKTELELQLLQKNEKTKKVKRKISDSGKGLEVKSGKKKKVQGSSEIRCPVCQEIFVDPPSSDWIQCSKCKNWIHEDCTAYPGLGVFLCEDCEED